MQKWMESRRKEKKKSKETERERNERGTRERENKRKRMRVTERRKSNGTRRYIPRERSDMEEGEGVGEIRKRR